MRQRAVTLLIIALALLAALIVIMVPGGGRGDGNWPIFGLIVLTISIALAVTFMTRRRNAVRVKIHENRKARRQERRPTPTDVNAPPGRQVPESQPEERIVQPTPQSSELVPLPEELAASLPRSLPPHLASHIRLLAREKAFIAGARALLRLGLEEDLLTEALEDLVKKYNRRLSPQEERLRAPDPAAAPKSQTTVTRIPSEVQTEQPEGDGRPGKQPDH